MNEIDRIADQARRTFEGPAWHGPALKEVLRDVGAQQAHTRPLAEAHTIWELVLHVMAWQKVALRRLGGEQVTDLPPDVDFPRIVEVTEAAWQRTLSELDGLHSETMAVIKAMADSGLDEIVGGVDAEWTAYQTLHGLIDHNLYHAGQIAILKKATGTSSRALHLLPNDKPPRL